ncbi:LacI family DNA-binding transcriptional regulator [Paracidobacterium acidisoli]|uniref:LacI family transcriptional regulator n=1 Tax=Paracidobacterium acidisoli TaxID=2303751 RepID=A0A372IRY8_9BACT|nr:LacI family DNA-binding transcriptional regulator [Paracidobacterium acidisoli]MBT9330596.1 LacI family transcriptional regulator [Paracidobacterium acidisoli]
MPVRLKDIARDLGVSVVTVSKVLRGSSDIGEKTRNRVLKRMRELDYRPNLMARGLASGRTYTAGLVVPDLVQPYFAELAKAISGVLRTAGRALILTSSEDDPQIEHSEIRTLLSRGVDVLLIASCQRNLKNFYRLGDQHVPYILLDRNFPQLAANFVGIDDFRAGEIATDHLLQSGRRRIAHIAGTRIHPSLERLRGYRQALTNCNLAPPESYVIMHDHLEEKGDAVGYRSMQDLLRLKKKPDAVFCYNDLAAIGAMQAADEAGVRIPEDIAFVGCGNVSYSTHLRHPLTSIDQSIPELGRIAGELALSLDQDSEQAPQTVLLEPKLIVRSSSAL